MNHSSEVMSEWQRHVLRSFLLGTRRTLRTGFDKKGSNGYPFQLLEDTPGCFIIQLTRGPHWTIFEPTVDYQGYTRRRWKSWHEEDSWYSWFHAHAWVARNCPNVHSFIKNYYSNEAGQVSKYDMTETDPETYKHIIFFEMTGLQLTTISKF